MASGYDILVINVVKKHYFRAEAGASREFMLDWIEEFEREPSEHLLAVAHPTRLGSYQRSVVVSGLIERE